MTHAHPNPDKIDAAMRHVALAALSLDGAALDMESAGIAHSPGETRADLVGWWQLGTLCNLGDLVCDTSGNVLDSHGGPYDFQAGADDLADFLGLDNHEALQAWAACHPDLWGTHNGSLALHSLDAYPPTTHLAPTPYQNLQLVVRHWTAVAARLRAFLKDRRRQATA